MSDEDQRPEEAWEAWRRFHEAHAELKASIQDELEKMEREHRRDGIIELVSMIAAVVGAITLGAVIVFLLLRA